MKNKTLSTKEAELFSLLSSFDAVSFDIFDTLVLRPFSTPTDLFPVLEKKLGIPGFKEKRIAAESQARQDHLSNCGSTEISIYDIYEILAASEGIDKEDGIRAELAAEEEFAYANPFMLHVFDSLVAEGKTVVLTSDMYIPHDLMKNLLSAAGFHGYSALYVSCDHGCSKADKGLFKSVLSAIGDKRLIHIGDNKHSDYEAALAAGISAVHYLGGEDFTLGKSRTKLRTQDESSTPIISCNDVSIRYIVGDFKEIGFKEYLIRKLTRNYKVKEFWADRHITFSINRGDMLGIIGTNGAGKSTLLKAISGIMRPTEGHCECRGKIAALLELGSGFDGDLTVKENTYLRGAMLGYTKKFMDDTYESIIDFAELKDFENSAFKQLSSGMKSRLAFSIASLVNPDILILDEVLSVGDGAFRAKSEEKMKSIITGGATTILVSHSMDQVRSMCNKILWLDHGNQVTFGDDVQGICDAYETFLETKVLPCEI